MIPVSNEKDGDYERIVKLLVTQPCVEFSGF